MEAIIMKNIVFNIEVKGYGIIQADFESRQQAEDFAAASFWWGGQKYRIFSKQVKQVAQ